MKMTAGEGCRSASARATPIPSWPGMAMSSSSRSGVQRFRHPDRAVAVGRGADQVDAIALGEQQLQPFGGERLVVGDQDAKRRVSHPIDPAAGSEAHYSRRRPSAHKRIWRANRSAPQSRWQTLAMPTPVPCKSPVLRPCRRTAAGVADLDRERPRAVPRARRSEHDLVARLRHRVLDHILDDRLEDQRRQAGVSSSSGMSNSALSRRGKRTFSMSR